MQENLENYSALNRSLRCLRYRNQFHSVYNVVFKDTLRTVWLKDPKQVWYWIIPLYKKEKKGKKKEEYRRRKTAELMRFCGEHSSSREHNAIFLFVLYSCFLYHHMWKENNNETITDHNMASFNNSINTSNGLSLRNCHNQQVSASCYWRRRKSVWLGWRTSPLCTLSSGRFT